VIGCAALHTCSTLRSKRSIRNELCCTHGSFLPYMYVAKYLHTCDICNQVPKSACFVSSRQILPSTAEYHHQSAEQLHMYVPQQYIRNYTDSLNSGVLDWCESRRASSAEIHGLGPRDVALLVPRDLCRRADHDVNTDQSASSARSWRRLNRRSSTRIGYCTASAPPTPVRRPSLT
jgi:hypothetical protein